MGTIVVRRAGDAMLLRRYRILVNGEQRAKLRWRGEVTLTAPDGPVTIQARIDWTGSAEWRNELGPEPLQVLVRPLDLIGGMVRKEEFLEVVLDGEQAPSPRPRVADRGARLLVRFAVLTLAALLFLVGIVALSGEPTWLAIIGTVWAVFLIVWIIDVVRVTRTSRRRRG